MPDAKQANFLVLLVCSDQLQSKFEQLLLASQQSLSPLKLTS